MKKKLLVIGLDCAAPWLVFDLYKSELPTLRNLMERGLYGNLKSCIPPITIPAWMVMMTGKNPGQLGLYGFRHRVGATYQQIRIPTSSDVHEPAVWDYVSQAGGKVCIIGVPPGFPPKPVNGYSISCFITPDSEQEFTYPPALKEKVQRWVGDYLFDVEFRTDRRDEVLRQLYEMTEKRFNVIRNLYREKEWDFFMFVEIGIDRVHHAFWKYFDPGHPQHEPGSKFANAVKDYYRFVDGKIRELLEMVDSNTSILVVSDHGAKAMLGALAVNEWLIREGYLVLKDHPKTPTPIENAAVDWNRTTAWGWGGYYARIFLNVKGREPQGTVEPKDYERVLSELGEKLKRLQDSAGRAMKNSVFRPHEIYGGSCKGDTPDLMVYFDDLSWRSVGTVGHGSVHLFENDTGPDDAVHDTHGIFILVDSGRNVGRIEGVGLQDVAPTLLDVLGIPVPAGMSGRVVR